MSSYFGGNNDKSSDIDEEEPYAGKLFDMIIVENYKEVLRSTYSQSISNFIPDFFKKQTCDVIKHAI